MKVWLELIATNEGIQTFCQNRGYRYLLITPWKKNI